VLAPYKELAKTRILRQIEANKRPCSDGMIPSSRELKQLLALRHGRVGDEIVHAALLNPIHDLTTRSAKHSENT
jgi:hypothetical protein